MAKRKRYYSEEEYTRLVNESFSDKDDSDDSSKELESESFSDSSDMEILSEPKIEACMLSNINAMILYDSDFSNFFLLTCSMK